MKVWIQCKKLLSMLASAWYTPWNKVRLKLNGDIYGQKLSVRGNLYIFKHYDSAMITLGDNVTINSAPWANPLGNGNRTYFQLFDGAKIKIGNYCGISNTAFSCASAITLEDNVLLGEGCKLYDTDFHSLDYSERIKGNYPGVSIKTAPIYIEEGVFIGAGTLILKGVTIGAHSTIGAGSVVAKNIPTGEVWGGNPARFIRKVEDNDKNKKDLRNCM